MGDYILACTTLFDVSEMPISTKRTLESMSIYKHIRGTHFTVSKDQRAHHHRILCIHHKRAFNPRDEQRRHEEEESHRRPSEGHIAGTHYSRSTPVPNTWQPPKTPYIPSHHIEDEGGELSLDELLRDVNRDVNFRNLNHF